MKPSPTMNAAKEEELTTCYHCGENCNGSIVLGTHRFCCYGCKTVFEILNENNLCNYYQLNNTPGTSPRPAASQIKFAYLNDEQVQQQLIRFNNGHSAAVTFYIPQIHCSSCIFLLENLYKLKPGIQRSTVNFLKRELSIRFNPTQLTLSQIVETLAAIGYEPHINLSDLNRQQKNRHLQRYYLKTGVAFFAFGNIMLLSFPEYLGINALAETGFRKFFGYLNFAIALPVLLYAAQEFFSSAFNGLKQKTLNMDFPIALGIAVMFLRSSYEVFSHTGAGYFDTMTGLVLFMLLGRLFQNKTYHTLSFERDYQSYFPVAVSTINNGRETTIPLTKLRVGDRLLIRNMELIPADAVLMKGTGSIDYSFVTGEAAPVPKQSGELIYAGGKHIGSAIEVEVTKEVSHSYLTQLWNDSAFNKTPDQNITTLANQMSHWFTPVVILIALSAGAYWLRTDLLKALNAFTSVLIITCPCALALSSPFTLGNMLRILGRSKIYLKNSGTVERLSKINTLVFDKTGTLTNTKNAKIEWVTTTGAVLSNYELRLVKSLVYHSSHPLSKKVNEHLESVKIITTHDYKETEGKGIEGWIDEHCVRIGSKKFLYGEQYQGAGAESDFRHASKIYVGIDGVVKGYYLVKNEYRNGFAGLIKNLRQHFAVYVLSGDNDAERNFLKQHIQEQNLIFGQQPTEKLQTIYQIQQAQHQVMMVGDGLNDAGALKQADVGVAISDDVNNFSPACDVILDASAFDRLYHLLLYAKAGVKIIKVSFIISLCYNIAGIILAVQGTMSPLMAAVLMPLSSVSIILFTTVASTIAGNKIIPPKM